MRSTGPRRDARSDRTQQRRTRRAIQEQQARRRRLMMLAGGGLALALVAVIALAAFTGGSDDGDGPASDLPVVAPPAIDAGIPREGRVLGNPDAPVTIVEYADYQCPACGAFATQIEPGIIRDYVATGKAKIEFRDFAFIGNESRAAAEAAACALEQGAFWEYSSALFANQQGENEGAFSRSRLVEIARSVGLDVDAFTSCIDGDEHEDEVRASLDEGRERGVDSTPTFFVNERKVTGASDAQLREAIEAELAS